MNWMRLTTILKFLFFFLARDFVFQNRIQENDPGIEVGKGTVCYDIIKNH